MFDTRDFVFNWKYIFLIILFLVSTTGIWNIVLFIHLFIHPSIHPPIHSFIHSFIHLSFFLSFFISFFLSFFFLWRHSENYILLYIFWNNFDCIFSFIRIFQCASIAYCTGYYRTIVWTSKFSGCINSGKKCSQKRFYLKPGSKKEFDNIGKLYIVRTIGILLLNRYEGQCVSKMFWYWNLLSKSMIQAFCLKKSVKTIETGDLDSMK